MATFAEGLLLGVKVTLRPVGFLAVQADLAAGLPPLLLVESGGHARVKGWGERIHPRV
jgi:hypothetical protein